MKRHEYFAIILEVLQAECVSWGLDHSEQRICDAAYSLMYPAAIIGNILARSRIPLLQNRNYESTLADLPLQSPNFHD